MPRLPLGTCGFHSPHVGCTGQSRPPDLNLLTLSTQVERGRSKSSSPQIREPHRNHRNSIFFIPFFFFLIKRASRGAECSLPGGELRTAAQTSVGLQIGPDRLKPGGNKRRPCFNNFWQKCFKRRA